MTGISFSGNAASVTGGASMVEASKTQQELTKFQSLLDSVKEQKETLTSVASSQIAESGRLNGDYTSSFSGTFTSQADKTAQPIGAAANTGFHSGETIDRTSELYEKSLELESYFVKMMLSSMRSTLSGTSLNGEEKSFAQNMYEDMLYDELAVSMTKNAGFGLADQIYLELQ
ncbi:MAG: rod-binding protein [Candidatus Treponema excrementipullorum]|uniref:Rod-binding protein n=1 Tax=Candidatus Treponema excrementipullorum TaxID=2838768 RepID=A0A9E2L4V0_9SPIR|nr:rod-binding protein [Candidatus Treponema excrementipullorum]MCI6480025.1 rod-binding protein [Spirochaetia bacterium]MCI6952905.1 rod-binding protein [Spirochaetia bacterium]MCI7588201.1 rod-binding protein [Spirochaetia bacterium]MDD7012460.1 rod-binding protein [Candidatus Treponema excrementipullorum]